MPTILPTKCPAFWLAKGAFANQIAHQIFTRDGVLKRDSALTGVLSFLRKPPAGSRSFVNHFFSQGG
jgi:hypothetical protein